VIEICDTGQFIDVSMVSSRWSVIPKWCGRCLTVRLFSRWCLVQTWWDNSCQPTLSSVKSWRWWSS